MENGSNDLLNAFRQGSAEAFEAAFETLFTSISTPSTAGFCASSAIRPQPKS